MHRKQFGRRAALKTLAGAAAWLGSGTGASAQRPQAPRVGHYRVWRVTNTTRFWIRDLVIENATEYSVYESNRRALQGRGTFTFDGQNARFLTGPFHELGYGGRSFVRSDGKHVIQLGNSVEAVSEN